MAAVYTDDFIEAKLSHLDDRPPDPFDRDIVAPNSGGASCIFGTWFIF